MSDLKGWEIDRFWSMVYITDYCWEWRGGRSNLGYGNFGTRKAHRVAYELLVGPIPQGLTLDHLCKNRACCKPTHLEPVTLRVNILRGDCPAAINARRETCRNGHPFDLFNTIWRTEAGVEKRRCRTCFLAYRSRRRAA